MEVYYSEYGYDGASGQAKDLLCNGCGGKGMGFLVPDTLFFLRITKICDRHDWGYEHGKTIEDKNRTDRIFLNNMIRKIDHNTKWKWVKRIRYKRAYQNYDIVQKYGGPWFWKDK